MADDAVAIEALALGMMRAWLAGDAKAMKKYIARDYMIMVGTLPPQLLDRPSFLTAIEHGFTCTRFAFREVFVRPHAKAAWLVAGAELELRVGARTWTGPFLVTSMWRKGAIGGWKAAELSLARLDDGDGLAAAISKMQLWK